jgi:predicted MFS family arabinose efflux permease
MAAALVAGAAVSRSLPTVRPPGDSAGSAAPWRVRGVPPVYLLALAMGLCLGLIESAVPARVDELGTPAASSGLLLALIAFGSGAGGLLAGGRIGMGADAHRPAAVLLVVLSALIVPAALVGSLPALAVTLLVLGVPIAPLNALGAIVLQGLVPPGRQAEGFAVFTAAVLIGAGIGQSLTGLLLDALGAQALLLGAAAVPLVAAVTVTIRTRRRTRTRVAS